MHLEQDRFVVAYDASKATAENLVAVIEKAGFTAELVTGGETVSAKKTSASIDDPIFTAALAQAKRENRPIVLDFEASWCVPCKRMARETFPDPTVSRLLDRCIFLKIDTDKHLDLAKGFGVAGLPDLRFLAPDGSERKRLLDFQDATTFAQVLKQFLEEVSTERDGLNTKEASVRTKPYALIDLAHDGREFKQAFNAQKGHVRVVLIVSPG